MHLDYLIYKIASGFFPHTQLSINTMNWTFSWKTMVSYLLIVIFKRNLMINELNDCSRSSLSWQLQKLVSIQSDIGWLNSIEAVSKLITKPNGYGGCPTEPTEINQYSMIDSTMLGICFNIWQWSNHWLFYFCVFTQPEPEVVVFRSSLCDWFAVFVVVQDWSVNLLSHKSFRYWKHLGEKIACPCPHLSECKPYSWSGQNLKIF